MAFRRRKRDKLNSAAHIKRNTEGTSNELSFSVLDAAKMELEGQLKNPSGIARPGKISLFTLGGKRNVPEPSSKSEGKPRASVKTSGWTKSERSVSSSEYEIARRKGRRKLHRVVAGALVAVTTIAIVAVAGTTVLSIYKANENNVESLQSTLKSVSAADEVLVRLNNVVEDPLNPDNQEDLALLEEELPDTKEMLSNAYDSIQAAFDEIVNPHDREAAGNALSSVNARIAMIDHGNALVDEASAALASRDSATDAWNNIMRADSLSREAASFANEGTEDSIASSKSSTEQAISALNDAAYQLSLAQEAYPDADFADFSAYVNKRIEAFGHAIASDDAFLAEDGQLALEENDAYNSADAEAAEIARTLPESVVTVIKEAFNEKMDGEIEAYNDASMQAASTDAFLRTYRDTA